MRAGPALVIVLLLGSPTLTASTAGTALPLAAFEPQPVRIGDAARYEAGTLSLGITVAPTATSINRAGAPTEVFGLQYDANGARSYLNLSLSTLRAEHYERPRPCGGRDCVDLIEIAWDHQGLPGIFGATLLHGRAFSIGDAWTAEGDCAVCAEPILVRIAAPNTRSPPGTEYVANISFRPSPSVALAAPWLNVAGEIHMGSEHAFPLKVQATGGRIYDLISFSEGGTPIPTSDLQPPAYRPPLAHLAAPYVDGRPAEGMPSPGHHSWHEARTLGLHDPQQSNPGLQVGALAYSILRTVTDVNQPSTDGREKLVRVDAKAELRWEVHYTSPMGGPTMVRYAAVQPAPYLTSAMPAPVAWVATTPYPLPIPHADCLLSTVPFWEGMRYGISLGIVKQFDGGYLLADCSGGDLTVWGDVHAASGSPGGSGIGERLTMQASTGFLVWAWYYAEEEHAPIRFQHPR